MARYAVGDIHGCSKSFEALLSKINLKKGDRLYLLGDIINRGPDSIGVMNAIFRLLEGGVLVNAIKGNHEEMLLNTIAGGNVNTAIALKKVFGLKGDATVPAEYLQWLQELPYFRETEEFVFVHAGLNFQAADPFGDIRSMLYIRGFEVDPERIDYRQIIHGHTPQSLEKTEIQIETSSDSINLDGGCVYFDKPGLGKLMALNLDNMQLFTQENIEEPYEIDLFYGV